MAQGDDLGRFSSKYSVHIRERESENYKLPSPNPKFSTEKHISRLKRNILENGDGTDKEEVARRWRKVNKHVAGLTSRPFRV